MQTWYSFPEGHRTGGQMPTRKLSFVTNQYYHIYNRGVNREAIFFLPDNDVYLLRLLKKNIARYGLSLAAYCLMPNHYHFLLKPTRDDTVAPFMQSVFGAYTQAVNRQQGRQGPLFQGRFRAILINEEGYFIQLARYIHANPVLSGLTDTPQAWPYSNYQDIIGQRNGTLKNADLVPGCFPTGEDYRLSVEGYIAEIAEDNLPGSFDAPGQPRSSL